MLCGRELSAKKQMIFFAQLAESRLNTATVRAEGSTAGASRSSSRIVCLVAEKVSLLQRFIAEIELTRA